MKLSLSTNWCNRRIDDGCEIAEKAIELGFEELELGFHRAFMRFALFRFRRRMDIRSYTSLRRLTRKGARWLFFR